eukprot:COSAG06_NODE_411_length_16063_cov_12.216738_3_plen_88_part_00
MAHMRLLGQDHTYVQHDRFRIQDSGFRIQDSGFRMDDTPHPFATASCYYIVYRTRLLSVEFRPYPLEILSNHRVAAACGRRHHLLEP